MVVLLLESVSSFAATTGGIFLKDKKGADF